MKIEDTVDVKIDWSDLTVTESKFGYVSVISGEKINLTPIKTYGFIKKPAWFEFWKKNKYKLDMEEEYRRLKEDFGIDTHQK